LKRRKKKEDASGTSLNKTKKGPSEGEKKIPSLAKKGAPIRIRKRLGEKRSYYNIQGKKKSAGGEGAILKNTGWAGKA